MTTPTTWRSPFIDEATGEVDLEALRAHMGPELFEAMCHGVLTICDAMAGPEVEPAQRARACTKKQERTKAS